MSEFDLVYGSLTVGHIKNAFLSDLTWYGLFQSLLRPTDSTLAGRILNFIDFTKQWNERVRRGQVADPTEFDQFGDIVKSGSWHVVNSQGIKIPILDAPVFFEVGDISWQTC